MMTSTSTPRLHKVANDVPALGPGTYGFRMRQYGRGGAAL